MDMKPEVTEAGEVTVGHTPQEVKPAVPEGYKRTEVGMIPEDWDVTRLGQIGAFSKGQGVRRDEALSGDIPCIRYGEIYTVHDDIVREYFSHISREVANTSKLLKKGDILFAGSGETKEEIGKAVAFVEDREAYAGGDIVILRQKEVAPGFLGYLLNSPPVVRQKSSKGQGDAVVHISASALMSVAIPVPPQYEQRAIATALNDLDALLEGLGRLIAKKCDLKQAAMQKLLTGQSRLPGFEGKWDTQKFDEVLVRLNAKENQIQTNDYQPIGMCPVVDQGKEAVVGFSDQRDKILHCPEGGVIVFGDHTCIVKFVSFDFLVGADGTQIIKARPGQITLFYAYQLQYRGVNPTGYNRHFKFLKEKEFWVPGEAEQKAIATVLSDMDDEIEALQQRRAKMDALKQAMMQELLTGRTRLV